MLYCVNFLSQISQLKSFIERELKIGMGMGIAVIARLPR